MLMPRIASIIFTVVVIYGCRSNEASTDSTLSGSAQFFKEMHRPQLHFTPREHWMNDPNGMVYHDGEYHLFYQYYPDGLTWGPMHWGHAVSEDLVHWEHLPIALYPDSLGYIFSGSAVVDTNNSSGLGAAGNPPMVAIYTYHSAEKEKAGRADYQYQGIAYSLDNGRTWTKYENNPVLHNQGMKDFRDPKVFWHDASGKWVMVLAVKDHVELWGSSDLKTWNKLSDFGYEFGAHGGVWECPDLFYSRIDGEQGGKWVMIVSINPGGVNGGSGTQYFVGDFDGKTFTPGADKNTTLWLDHGPDDYAGVTFANAPDNRRIFIGWMSNWAYAQDVPTTPWRSAMTLPRDLSIGRVGGQLYVRSALSPETSRLVSSANSPTTVTITDSTEVSPEVDFSKSMVTGIFAAKDFIIQLYNQKGQKVVIGFDQSKNQFFVDRGTSGKNDFSGNFNPVSIAPRVSSSESITFTFVADVSSLEVFFDDGLTVMTSLHFPDEPLSRMRISTATNSEPVELRIRQLDSIWR
jgi:fructan beta-fructosidase